MLTVRADAPRGRRRPETQNIERFPPNVRRLAFKVSTKPRPMVADCGHYPLTALRRELLAGRNVLPSGFGIATHDPLENAIRDELAAMLIAQIQMNP